MGQYITTYFARCVMHRIESGKSYDTNNLRYDHVEYQINRLMEHDPAFYKKEEGICFLYILIQEKLSNTRTWRSWD